MSRESVPQSADSSVDPLNQTDDDKDFVLVVNRKKHHAQVTDSYRKQRQSHDMTDDERQSQASYNGRRRKYRDRGGTGEHKNHRRKDKQRDKENIIKTGSSTGSNVSNVSVTPPPPQNPPQQISTVRSFSLVVAGGASAKSTQTEEREEETLANQVLVALKPKHESVSSGVTPSTSSSIPDTSSLTSEETDSIGRKTSADAESNEGSTTNVVEYVDAPVPKVNPWVANRNAVQVITGVSGFPAVAVVDVKPSKPAKAHQERVSNPPSPVTSFSEAVASPKQKSPAQELPKPEPILTQSVYVREMSNGFRPGKGRGSYSASASAGRKIPSRSSVLMKVVGADGKEDWPTLGEAVVEAKKEEESSKLIESVDSQGSGLEEKSAPPQKSVSPKPESPSPPPPKNESQHPETSSSDNDEVSGSSSQRRGSKQKWVPLDMTSQERGVAVEKQKSGKGKPKYQNYYQGGYQRARGKENVAINGGNEYSDYAPHGRYQRGPHHHPPHNRSNGPQPQRGQPPRPRRQQGPNHRSNSTLSLNNHSMMNGSRPHHPYEALTSPTPQDFEFSPDFTTLTPMYPAVSEFIMPYVTNGYFPTPFTPPPGVIVETGGEVVAPVIVPSTQAPPPASFTGDVVDLVRTQIEYYFSEENLPKDFYLRRKMDRNGYLPVPILATFPRVKQLTQDYSTVLTAIQTSEALEMDTSMTGVRTRVNPDKWPLPDSSSDKTPGKCINNNNTPGGGLETLNPNVPEFVPKSKLVLS